MRKLKREAEENGTVFVLADAKKLAVLAAQEARVAYWEKNAMKAE